MKEHQVKHSEAQYILTNHSDDKYNNNKTDDDDDYKTSANMNKVEFVEVNNDESNKALKDIETDKTSTNVNKVESKGE